MKKESGEGVQSKHKLKVQWERFANWPKGVGRRFSWVGIDPSHISEVSNSNGREKKKKKGKEERASD